jgi:uncharacterized membrane protein (UPF0127 family)
MRHMLRGLFTVGFVVSAVASGHAEDVAYPTSELWVESGDQRHHFAIEVAETPAQVTRGLMFRAELADDAGMLFDYDPPQRVSMWMKNTLIPLDMLFVDERGVIGRIAAWTTPLSLKPIPSGGPVRAVIELKGGITQQLGIKVGDTVVHSIFGE